MDTREHDHDPGAKQCRGRQECSMLDQDSFAHCCANFDPFFGFACDTEEYHAKNMSTEGGGVRAIGIDIGKYLPGLYWLNFFGLP
jgi:hypothetical protein